MQHGVAGAVGGGAGSLCRAFAEASCHAAKRPLIYFTVFRAGERHTVMLQFDHGIRCFLAHVLDCVLVTQPVRTFDGVVHMPAPVVLAHVAQRCADAALRGNRVAARRKYLCDARRIESGFGQSKRCP